MDEPNDQGYTINTSTGISIGIFLSLIIIIVGGVLAFSGIKSSMGENKSELLTQMGAMRSEFNDRANKMENKITNLETNKNSLTASEFLLWAIHLQQSNSDPKKLQTEGLKVPEPQISTK